MNVTELRTRVKSETTKFGPSALNDRTQLIMKSDPGRLGGNPAVERLHTVKQNGEPGAKIDPLMQALVDRLPQAHAVWSIEDRGKWLKAAAMAFNLIYKTE